MPTAIVFGNDREDCLKLVSTLEKQGMRVKFSFEYNHVVEWLNLGVYDLMCIDTSRQFEEQEKLGHLLWDKNPQAVLIIYNLNPASIYDEKQSRLFGAELAIGDVALSRVEKIVGRINATKYRPLAKQEMKILVVDDLDSPRDMICMYIEALGYTSVQGVSSVKEALDEIAGFPNDISCVVTDIRMPLADGHSLIRSIRSNQKTKNIPIIVLTAHGSADCLVECLREGVSGFLSKPPKKSDLTRELARAVRIANTGQPARLVQPEEVDQILQNLKDQGFC